MKRLFPLAFVLFACGPSGGDGTHVPDSAASGRPLETTTQAAPPAPRATAVAGNPNRLYQLDTLKKVDVDLKGHSVHLWVMDDESKQQEGMMFLEDKDVKPDEGMLFAFDKLQLKSAGGFWMHNTLIPLDIVYLSPKGQVVTIAHGKVKDDTSLPAEGDYQNVIELKAGTAARFGLKPGDTVTVPKVP